MTEFQMMNIQDIANRLQRDRGIVRSWYVRSQYDFPPPTGRFALGEGAPYWSLASVEAWIESNPSLVNQVPAEA